MDFKLTITNLSTDPTLLAQGIIENYGENFDAERGDFTVTVDRDTVEVIAKDVAKGDMRYLREDIYRDFGDEDETMIMHASYGERGGWFSTELDEDD